MRLIILLTLLLLSALSISATNVEVELKRGNHSQDSIRSALVRSQKIVDKLVLADKVQQTNVLHVIANRYLELFMIHAEYDARNERIKALGLAEQAEKEELERSYYEYNSFLYRSRFGYIAWLSFYLNEEQIETVKNEMTENMLLLRYAAFMEMLPQLTNAEKQRVHAWLVEAREFSMDFIARRKMQQMFTKYRGRINNYLSACGYEIGNASAEQKARQLREIN
ncbi:DUF3826 domain-containing protein [Bacteroides sp. 214]|uniref:DUF3826 domain-containing protein n=1 Tax=Bacteroides sp. 214 TaxID=2302935 RepID=UPI0013CF8A8D|nr:DUF3826 domain-containing protein [Bacteroides sp. 214]NDW12208.1 DUF3826 domain-containing protein [Bacteroides sp. 214]